MKNFDFNKALQESMGGNPNVSGFNTGAFPYFKYEVLPLSSSLSQKGNETKNTATKAPHLVVGDRVKGICAYDDKTYIGNIQRFYVEEGQTKPVYIYIINDNSMIIPLKAETVKRIKSVKLVPAEQLKNTGLASNKSY